MLKCKDDLTQNAHLQDKNLFDEASKMEDVYEVGMIIWPDDAEPDEVKELLTKLNKKDL